MITSFKFDNCYTFNKLVEMSLKADMRTKKFSTNIIHLNENLNILKSAVIYGPNNTGKTCIVNCIRNIKNTLENKGNNLMTNIFNKNNIAYREISFINNGKEYSYEYKFDCQKKLYVYEKMTEIVRDKYNNQSERLIFLKDAIENKYECPEDKNLKNVLNIASTGVRIDI